MKKYTKYLFLLGYRTETIKQYTSSLQVFSDYLELNSIPAESCSYQNILDFIDQALLYFQNRANPRSTINRMLVAISHYFDSLMQDNSEISNPVRNLRVKDSEKSNFNELLNEADLADLYNQTNTSDARSIRNKVLLGFLVFQGLQTRELHNIVIDDLKLRNGSIFIRGDHGGYFKKGSTSRELNLEALQIIDLIDYTENIRPRILAGRYRSLPGRNIEERKINYKSDQLLLSLSGSENIKSSMFHLFQNLREINSSVTNAIQIRQSVITLWINKYDLRRVQYMAGHRYVSSTEHYKQIDLELLQRKVLQYHPLR